MYPHRDSRVQVVHQRKRKKGVSDARNTGISHAKGRYIIFASNFFNFDLSTVTVLVDE